MGAGTQSKERLPEKVRYCLYARKSSESEERQVLSIDSQIKEMLLLAERESLEIVTMKRESHSAKETGTRPVFNEILEEIRQGKYNGILTWAPDLALVGMPGILERSWTLWTPNFFWISEPTANDSAITQTRSFSS